MSKLPRLAAPALLLAASCAAPPASGAAAWKVRAREHFETGTADLGDGRGTLSTQGFLSAFNLFHERPFDRLIGLTAHRGRVGRVGSDETATITALGAEAKVFPSRRVRLAYLRGGLLSEAVDPSGPAAESWNHGLSAGAGVEFPVWKLGIAPETGLKALWASRGRGVATFYLAFGLHFYVFPGDTMDATRPSP